MKEKIIYEYCLLRYVPDIERGEFINVGLMMMCKRYRWMQCALHVDGERIEAFIPKQSDVDRLNKQLALFTRSDVPFPGLSVEERYRWLAAVKSAVIQTSPSHPGVIPAPADLTRQSAADLLSAIFQRLFLRLVK